MMEPMRFPPTGGQAEAWPSWRPSLVAQGKPTGSAEGISWAARPVLLPPPHRLSGLVVFRAGQLP